MERQLINYLPYVIRDYDVFKALTVAEQPEFELAWDAQELAFANQYIDTADDYGLSRWEKILQIIPRGTDTLESRRIKIKAKLNTIVPYTIRALIQKITTIADGSPFTVNIEVGTYLLQIITQWETNGQVDSLKDILEQMLPVNIAVDSRNEVICEPFSTLFIGSGLGICEMISVTDYGMEHFTFETPLKVPADAAFTENINLTD